GEFAKKFGAKGLAWIKVLPAAAGEDPNAKRVSYGGVEANFSSTVMKFVSAQEAAAIGEATGAKPGDLLLFGADKTKVVAEVLGRLRLKLAEELKLIDHSQYNLLWVVDFPMFEHDEDEQRWDPIHHPFTSPLDSDVGLLESDPGRCRAKAYDLVLNGTELGGGSIRIHRRDVQNQVFRMLGLSDEEIVDKFGFMLEA